VIRRVSFIRAAQRDTGAGHKEHVHSQPVLTRPYSEPKRHWKTVSGDTRNEIVNRRRPADEPLPMGQTVATQQDLGFGDIRADAGAIDKLRSEVRAWRDQGWPGTTNHDWRC